jgi:hypothetical protein
VQLIHPEPGSFEIRAGSQLFRVPVSPDPSTVGFTKPRRGGAFAVTPGEIEFDCCQVGFSKELQIEISNREAAPLMIELRTANSDVFSCPSSVIVPAKGQEIVSVQFTPDRIATFDSLLTIENDNNRVVIPLQGEGADDAMSLSEIELSQLEFPDCVPGMIRRAQLRVTNRTNQVVSMMPETSDPFVCAVSEFDIEPMSFVLVPIRFVPREPGHYEGHLILSSSSRRTSTVRLIGNCYG